MSEVEFRSIPGFEGYRVGSDGTVWTERKRGQKSGTTGVWKLIRQSRDKSAKKYFHVHIRRSTGEYPTFTVHELVAPAPVGSWWCSAKYCGYHSTCPFINNSRKQGD